MLNNLRMQQNILEIFTELNIRNKMCELFIKNSRKFKV